LKDYTGQLKDYAVRFLGQVLRMPCFKAVNLGIFPLSLRVFCKKTKISRWKRRAIREIRWLEEDGGRKMLISILSISELWTRQ